ncbi:MAG: CoA transferase [Chloroflexi bacterium]|nr:CoA transferase [Chloroflexota bacterium]
MSMLPLARYRIVDFGTAWAGAMVGQLLADMGAEVIRVESREKLDGIRLGWPGKGQPPDPELNTHFHGLNRNKLSITANMKTPEGLALIKDLVRQSDVVYDNFTPGVLERTGLDYESLRKIKADIISLSLPSAGKYGPYKDIRSYASTLGALAGIEGMVGYPGGRVLALGFAFADANGGIHGAMAIVLALLHRDRTGEGQMIDLSQWEATTSLLGELAMDYTMNGRDSSPPGNTHLTLAPHGNYPCKGADDWVSIAVDTEAEWKGLCKAMGNPAWISQAKFSDKFGRLKNREALDKHIGAWTKKFGHCEITEILQKAGVAAAPLFNFDDLYTDRHYAKRRLWVKTRHPRTGEEPVYGIPWKLSATPGRIRKPAPLLGSANKYIYNELLGLSRKDIARLVEAKALY